MEVNPSINHQARIGLSEGMPCLSDRYMSHPHRAGNLSVIVHSSLRPPATLRSHNYLMDGHLKKKGSNYTDEEYTQYRIDVPRNLQFSTDVLSIHNEPENVNPTIIKKSINSVATIVTALLDSPI
ncbi:hypothetical protein [Anditalea andensis]|uniref:Uncharacterized protein n=1 Tax=Anditalea andensis TaxID=1048983 RepID=A0A074L5K6_9BACT|nr:hypothetical protein [Anditalea andensis]KEO75765.1 hypothetical protein EL17_22325 [Anditalea andensis]